MVDLEGSALSRLECHMFIACCGDNRCVDLLGLSHWLQGLAMDAM